MGKSVVLKHIIGLIEPDKGEILFKNKNFRNMNKDEKNALKKKFSSMFQNMALFDSMTAFENIALPLNEKRVFSKHINMLLRFKEGCKNEWHLQGRLL